MLARMPEMGASARCRTGAAMWVHQELGILVSGGCSTQATSGNQRKPGNLDISKLMSDFPETYTAIGCQGAMETETYEVEPPPSEIGACR